VEDGQDKDLLNKYMARNSPRSGSPTLWKGNGKKKGREKKGGELIK